MIIGNALLVYKQQLLCILDNYSGMEQVEQQVVQDFQISYSCNARPDDVRQALETLHGDGLAEKRRDTLRGWVWKINREGHAAAAKIELEN